MDEGRMTQRNEWVDVAQKAAAAVTTPDWKGLDWIGLVLSLLTHLHL